MKPYMLARRFWLLAGLLAFLALVLAACQRTPDADFSASITSGSAPVSIQFTDLSKGDPDAWQWDFGDGTTSTEQNPTHEFTAVGTYEVSLLATRGDNTSELPKTIVVTVSPGPVDRIELSPPTATLAPQGEQAFSVRAFDAFSNEVEKFDILWKASLQAGTIDQRGTFKASTTAGDYPTSVEVAVAEGDVTRSAVASITVLTGTLDRVELAPKSLTAQAGESHQFTAQAYDQFGNVMTDAQLSWGIATETGTLTQTGIFSANVAGESPRAIRVEAQQDEVTKSDTATLTVLPGPPARVEVNPAPLVLLPGISQQITGAVFDQFGNEITGPILEWEITEGGRFSSGDLFIADTSAGEYEMTVTAKATSDQEVIQETIVLTIEPDALAQVVIAPQPATVVAGMTQQFTAAAYDSFGNEIPDVTFGWLAREEAGRINSLGIFSASEKAGMHADAVTVEAIEGSVTKINRSAVIVEPGPPYLIEVRPNRVTVAPGQVQAFTTTVFDLHRNEIRDVAITWSVAEGGGTIDESGTFIAGEELGLYPETILVEANYQGDKATAKVTVTIAKYRPGKIVFNTTLDGETDIYVMDHDGGNITRITLGEATNYYPAWSPDGSKIVFTSWRDDNAEIYIMDADGSNPTRLTDNLTFDAWATWSPLGDRIAFTSTRIQGGFDIFVMDADGSNVTRLTENRRFDTDVRPYWSPDGTMILYASDEGNEFDPEVWVINADGTNKRRLTDNRAVDVGVAWYPDGSKILFLSDEDGQVDLDLYMMNVDGTEVVRLTFTPSIWEELASYSPDGSKIVFNNFIDQQLWIMDADGRNPRPITEGLFLSGYAQWQLVPEVPVVPFVVGATVAPEEDLEGPGDHFPIQPSSILPEEESFEEYNTVPPTSGPHWRQPAPWGIYASPIADERQVANLAHGGVIIQYNTDDSRLIARLEAFVRDQRDSPCHLILAPRTDMPFTISITAWGVRDTMDAIDEERLQEFIDFYRGKGPEASPCPS